MERARKLNLLENVPTNQDIIWPKYENADQIFEITMYQIGYSYQP